MRAVLVAAIAAFAAFTPVPVTHADPDPDPHIPDITANYWPGGMKWLVATTYCDGMPYADGSYWHIVRTEPVATGDDSLSPKISPMKCVVTPGGGVVPQWARAGRMRGRGPLGRVPIWGLGTAIAGFLSGDIPSQIARPAASHLAQ
ncbi:MAG: hypothetical protein WBF82_17815 [Mycobacterium sp.]